ncbi:MAG TPA: zinc-ribbon domain containing protein [Desulfobacterales bacterium]
MTDVTIVCIQCDREFELDDQQQEHLHSMGFDLPKRCPECRKRKSKAVKMARHPDDKKKHFRMKYER